MHSGVRFGDDPSDTQTGGFPLGNGCREEEESLKLRAVGAADGGKSVHQIDHVVPGLDQLFVLETKTWRGRIEGRAGDRQWTLRRPRSREVLTVYNPLFQYTRVG